MSNLQRVFAMKFSSVYPLYVQKVEKKGRAQVEVDRVICWLTGYTQAGLEKQLELPVDLETFFAQAPALNPNAVLVTGVVCGVRVEEVPDPLYEEDPRAGQVGRRTGQGQGDGEDLSAMRSTHMGDPSIPRAAARVAVLTAMLLLVPLVAMQFTTEANWAPADFVAAGVLLFGAGMAYMLATRRARTTRQKVVVGSLVFTTLAVVWAELAVGLFH